MSPPEPWAEPRRIGRARPSRRVVSAAGIGVAVAATVAGAVLITTNGHGGAKVASSKPPARVSVVPTTAPAAPTTSTTAASLVGQVVPTPTGDASVAVHGPFTLSLHATGRCWVQVVGATGQSLFEGTLNPGQTQSVSGAPPLTVRLGNTRGITLLVDGSNLDLAGVANTANVQFQLG